MTDKWIYTYRKIYLEKNASNFDLFFAELESFDSLITFDSLICLEWTKLVLPILFN